MLDYQNSLEQMAGHQQGNILQSQYPTQQPTHLQQQVTDTTGGYFYQDAPRQPFPLNSAPLAALHSVADIKTPLSVSAPPSALTNYNPAAYYSMKNSMLNATPHGITDILSRPGLQAQLQARLGQGMYYNSCGQTGQQMTNISPPSKDSSNVNRSPYNWPGNEQVLQPSQPAIWHGKQGGMLSLENKDSKKKNTRPTFSGSQIFALEKTFEQQKYLAGPERGRLAYALGMSESQVKVWFQNRRTKWRKRHAAEIATTKRHSDNPSMDSQSFEGSRESACDPSTSFPTMV